MILMNLTCLAIAGACIWIVILLLPWRPWATAEFLDAAKDFSEEDLSDITVLIPARNETGVIETTLTGLKTQGDNLNIILVDDQSVDGTARAAKASAGKNLRVISGTLPKAGWSGKLWALEQGLRYVDTELLLLLDADIELKPGILQTLRKKDARRWSPINITDGDPANGQILGAAADAGLYYFFKMLYPFRLSNSTFPWVCRGCRGLYPRQTEAIKKSGALAPCERTDR